MAGKQRADVREEDITGLKLFDKLVPMLKSLHEVGCERDKAGNRRDGKGVRNLSSVLPTKVPDTNGTVDRVLRRKVA